MNTGQACKNIFTYTHDFCHNIKQNGIENGKSPTHFKQDAKELRKEQLWWAGPLARSWNITHKIEIARIVHRQGKVVQNNVGTSKAFTYIAIRIGNRKI